ncbi:MAG: hypothetical protein ABUK19_08970, partial [Desulfobacteria bacterium]
AFMPAAAGFIMPQTRNATTSVVENTANLFMRIPPVVENHIIYNISNVFQIRRASPPLRRKSNCHTWRFPHFP